MSVLLLYGTMKNLKNKTNYKYLIKQQKTIINTWLNNKTNYKYPIKQQKTIINTWLNNKKQL
jgi:hypothetical protein